MSAVSWFQRAQAALQAVNAAPDALAAGGGVVPGQGSVLRIIVENVFYPVTLEVLYQVMRTGKTNNKICFYVAGVIQLFIYLFIFNT